MTDGFPDADEEAVERGKVMPAGRAVEKRGASAVGASALGTGAIGSLAIGALALGALALGALAIGAVAVGHGRCLRAGSRAGDARAAGAAPPGDGFGPAPCVKSRPVLL